MCKWSDRPRGRAKRRAWLKRYIVVLNKRLEAGFNEAWYKRRHFTVESQRRACVAKVVRATHELEAFVS
jgi:hypothetical protein